MKRLSNRMMCVVGRLRAQTTIYILDQPSSELSKVRDRPL